METDSSKRFLNAETKADVFRPRQITRKRGMRGESVDLLTLLNSNRRGVGGEKQPGKGSRRF